VGLGHGLEKQAVIALLFLVIGALCLWLAWRWADKDEQR
jgi:HAMP domain-containing protein